ncbi:hypothetical protein Glove_271g48 [Diversispora epigaea]|uniref:TLDc domain-containing protein n=1 Tax=Diversispora epigaea TaxID=1348612 RepID=A0A397I4G3_9GLOM|nr:hypothetical protein Glove_271g48 [Diversispora epigaea]
MNLKLKIVKVKGKDEILGGYNPLAWDVNTDGSCCNDNGHYEKPITAQQQQTISQLLIMKYLRSLRNFNP